MTNDQPIRVALYARVSTLAGQDPEMQLRELREYCQRRGLQIVEEFIDKGISGSKERRPSLDRLMVTCRKRMVDGVVVPLRPVRSKPQTTRERARRVSDARN